MSGGDPNRWYSAGSHIFKFTPEALGASSQVPAGPLVIGKLDQIDPALGVVDWKAMMRIGYTPEAAADIRFNAQRDIYIGSNKPRLDRYEVNHRVDVWEYDNEVVPDTPQEADWFTSYSIEMAGLFETIGKRYCMFNFAVGTPDIRPGDPSDIWPHLLPAVRYARDHGHYVGLHEYMGYEPDYGVGWRQVDANRNPTVSVWHGSPDKTRPYGWTVLRYRYIVATYFQPAGLGDTRLLITECGCDSVDSVTPAGYPVGTWTEHIPNWLSEGYRPADRYAGMVGWYDERLREDSIVVGATIFTVGSVGNWANWDIAGTEVESLLLNRIAALRDEPDDNPPPPPTNPPPEIPMTNSLLNGSFEKGWYHPEDANGYPIPELQLPVKWDLKWRGYPDWPNPYDASEGARFVRPEVRTLPIGQLPLAEQSLFVRDGQYTLKAFKGNGSLYFSLMQTVTGLTPGAAYRLTAPVFPDLVMRYDGGRKIWADDPNAGLWRLRRDDEIMTGVLLSDGFMQMDAGEWNILEVSFRATKDTHTIKIDFLLPFPLPQNGIFADDWQLVKLPEQEPPPPPSVSGYKSIVFILPQDATADETAKAVSYIAPKRRTLTFSHDDLKRLLTGGNQTSYAEIAYSDRQKSVVEMVESLGYQWVVPDGFANPQAAPLAGLKLGHIFAYRYDMTSPFNAPRSYAGGKHEGVDYDVIGGATNNKVDVLCVYDGVVDRSLDTTAGYGKYVRVRHVYNGVVFYTRYAHLDERYVKVGQSVVKGQPIGEVGASGNVTGEHVHLNLEVPGRGLSGYVVADVIDPTPYMPSGASLPLYTTATFDLLPYLKGDGRIYQMNVLWKGQNHGQQMQTQTTQGGRFYLVKNNQWEELWSDGSHIWRGADTSPGDGMYYVQRTNALEYGAVWCPRHWKVGGIFERNPLVTFYNSATGQRLDEPASGFRRTWLKFERHYGTYQPAGSPMPFSDVVELRWLPKQDGPWAEKYFYARDLGLVAWESSSGDRSWVTEVFAPNERQAMERERVAGL